MTANPLAPFTPSNEVNHKTETPVSPAKSENKVEAKNVCELSLKVRNREELLAELSGFSDNLDLWYLTYMLHTGEHFMLAEAKEKEEGKLKFDHNRFGFAKNAINRLENMTKSKMKSFSDTSWHEYTWFVKMDKDNRPNVHALCSVCKDKLDFCPHKMTAYIEHVCLKLGLDKEEIYRCILGKRYSKKSDFDVYEELSDIPVEEYGFIDAVSATAAAELLKMNLMRVSAETDDRILYSYLPLCEKTKHSFISDAMAFYRSGQGKTDFVYKEDFRSQLDENRNCPDCIFPQCPDKVALYLLVLADRYSVNVMKLARFVIEKNRLGMSANGFFNYYEQTKELEKIPLTPESRKTVHNIIKYTINKFYVDKVVPFIPFNMAIYTRDELQADQLVKILKEMFNFYHYWDKKAVITECRFSSVSLTGLIETI
ncbi:MAG: hypothetical protein UIG59_08895, partial [Acutalibacteraceae bacterium]|nr:hypothetical protein [Acutalibacteraceae bacterium]